MQEDIHHQKEILVEHQLQVAQQVVEEVELEQQDKVHLVQLLQEMVGMGLQVIFQEVV
jgi:hypothetical protein